MSNEKSMQGQVALVTGASRGIGQAIAHGKSGPGATGRPAAAAGPAGALRDSLMRCTWKRAGCWGNT